MFVRAPSARASAVEELAQRGVDELLVLGVERRHVAPDAGDRARLGVRDAGRLVVAVDGWEIAVERPVEDDRARGDGAEGGLEVAAEVGVVAEVVVPPRG